MRNPFRRKSWFARLRQRFAAAVAAAWNWIVSLAVAVWEWIVAVASAIWAWIIRAYLYVSGGLKRRATVARLRAGDIILASPRTLRLSPVALLYRLILRARYVHSMLYLGDRKIIHTTMRAGVTVGNLPRKIYRKDRYTILRAPQLGPAQRDRVVAEAMKFEDTKLDRAGLVSNVPARLLGLKKPLLRFERDRLWCSKLIYHAYSAAGIDLVPGENIETITSEDLSRSPRLERVQGTA
ncbi:MAG: hypothetical protein GWN99_19560 [Gemmatimonadetes bacterium]|uniref:Permuted papain-like amidase YaeF/Yiix C92 family enzyme n=1 Tax=Candidatus Kutchimonas denitrificans TaxID=3056748 RepID=A0AAE4ZBW2_9BACT|nr:hypothetical protein [Candidatus Kutchimonas denitrificans]NIS03227.1 hypothetical protein [Gemmatimonadota bacterium]NIU52019.1 hypothetical protein [Gemmatimonadota bacterium]NIW35889.1 hypothetical protein [Gemmatimonadota bacterium]NIY45724.1 hypothetical protein [Gemmatimonadota bacterium]